MKKKQMMITAGVSLVAVIIIAVVAFMTASATEVPVVDEPPTPIDADRYTITGTAEPGAKITVTGGAYQLSPTYADDDGYWEKTVTLVQESTNTFYVFATGEDGLASDSVMVDLVEGAEEAAAAEAETGVDLTAPDTPEVDEVESPIDADTLTITGTAEAGVTIMVSGDDIEYAEVDSQGEFSVEVDLQQNEENKFYVSAMNDSGIISQSTTVEVEEISAEEEEEEESAEPTLYDDEEETNTVSFNDLDGHWGEEYILELAELGIVDGYDNGGFGPNDYITRAAITKIALNAFEYEVSSVEGDFSDVEEGAWYEDYVNSAYEAGIVSGDPEGTFRPGDYVNRAEAMKILLGASGVADMAGSHVFIGDEDSWENPFSDMTSADWFYEYVMQAYTGEVVSGYSDGTFGGGNNITRAEVCKIVLGLLDLEYEIKSTPSI